MGAAERTLDLDRLRERLERDRAPVPHDSAFAADERRVREAAAARLYGRGRQHLEERRPKQAYLDFVDARALVPGFRDLDERIPRTWERAVTRVAVLPFNDEAGLPGAIQPLTESLAQRLARRLRPAEFTFTRLVPLSEVWARLPAAELGHLDRPRAISIARAVGAQRVVFGRVWNLRSDTDTDRWSESIWHPVTEKDTSGKAREAWIEVPFAAVSRVRAVHVEVEFEVLDADEEEFLERRSVPFDAVARTAYTRQEVDGDCDDYRLVPPSLERADRDRARRIEARWKGQFGPWTLPGLLEEARRTSGGLAYSAALRGLFWPPRERPVFLDDLPPAEDLAALAIEGVWEPVLETLRALDSR
jgi:hypothetical protein